MVPIILIIRRRVLKEPIRFGPWRMGRWGIYANMVGLFYSIVGFFFSFWPPTAVVDAENMNWACLVWGAAMLFCVFWYTVRGHHYYKGPIREVNT